MLSNSVGWQGAMSTPTRTPSISQMHSIQSAVAINASSIHSYNSCWLSGSISEQSLNALTISSAQCSQSYKMKLLFSNKAYLDMFLVKNHQGLVFLQRGLTLIGSGGSGSSCPFNECVFLEMGC